MQLEDQVISLQQFYAAAIAKGIPVVTMPLNRRPLMTDSKYVFGHIEDAHILDVPLAEDRRFVLGTNGRAPYRPLTQMPDLGSNLKLGVYEQTGASGSPLLIAKVFGGRDHIRIEPL